MMLVKKRQVLKFQKRKFSRRNYQKVKVVVGAKRKVEMVAVLVVNVAKREPGPIAERVKLRLPVGVRKNEFSLSMIIHNSLILMREKLDRMF